MKKKKKKSKNKKYGIIILIVTILMLIYILKDEYNEILNLLKNANLFWIIGAIVLFCAYFTFDLLAMYHIMKTYKKDVKLSFALYLGAIAKFFNGITPLATGGQPMIIYEMHKKKDIDIANGTNIVVQNYIIFQIALIIWCIIAIILNKTMNLFAYDPVLKNLSILGFTINFLILIFLGLVSFNKHFNKLIISFLIKVLSKLRIVKDKEEKIKKVNSFCENYYVNAHKLIKNKKLFLTCIFDQFMAQGIYYAMPIFIAFALNIGDSLTLVNTIAASAYVYIIGCYVPIPGGSGGMEFAFLGFFGNYIADYSIKALVLMWRFITYYLPTIVGAIVYNTLGTKEESSF